MRIGEKNVKDMQRYLFAPTCCLPQTVVIRYHLISPINTWHAFITISDDVWLHFLLPSSIRYLHHFVNLYVANHQGMSLVFPFGNNGTISASAYNVSFVELCFCNLFWVGFTITSNVSHMSVFCVSMYFANSNEL